MTFAGTCAWIAAAWWVAAVAILCVTVVAAFLQPFVQRRRGRGGDLPPVSLVVPVKALDPGFVRAQDSLLAQTYPQAELIVSAVEEDSPALAAMREILARFPLLPARMLRSAAYFAASPKLNNLVAPFRDARHPLIFMKDSNTILGPGDLEAAVRQLTPDVGLVVAVPVADGAANFAARIEESIMNGAQARMLLTASLADLGIGVGKFMLFRRADLERAGGIAALASTVGEDNAMGKALARIGLKTIFSHRVVRQELGRRRLADVYDRQMRWAVIRRDEERMAFVGEPLTFVIPAALAGALAAPLVGIASLAGLAATIVGWLALEALLAIGKGWGVSLSTPAAFIAREMLLPAVWINAWLTNRVVWAHGTYEAKADVAAPALGALGSVRKDREV